MSHTHTHTHDSSKNITIAFFLNFGFTIIELVGGLLTNSVAILSDALHDFGDSISLGLAWYFDRLSKRKPSNKFTYGYKRFSLLGALINSMILIVGSTVVVVESIKRLINPEPVVAEGMILLAVVGVVVNGIAVLRTRKGSGINERVVSLHLLEDVLGWITVLVGSTVMYFWNVPMLDSIMSIAISCFIAYNVVKNLRSAFGVLLQRVPEEADTDGLREKVAQVEGVKQVHDFHVWSLDSEYHIASLHVVVDNPTLTLDDLSELKLRVKHALNAEGIDHVTVEMESEQESGTCESCQ